MIVNFQEFTLRTHTLDMNELILLIEKVLLEIINEVSTAFDPALGS